MTGSNNQEEYPNSEVAFKTFLYFHIEGYKRCTDIGDVICIAPSMSEYTVIKNKSCQKV